MRGVALVVAAFSQFEMACGVQASALVMQLSDGNERCGSGCDLTCPAFLTFRDSCSSLAVLLAWMWVVLRLVLLLQAPGLSDRLYMCAARGQT